MTTTIPTVPDAAPPFGGRFSRLFGRFCLNALGWRLTGEIPNYSKVILVGAPHSSNWDFILSMCCSLACGIKLSYLMKKEAFIWPLKGLFLYLGGIPVNTKSSQDIVPPITPWIKTNDNVWIVLTPAVPRTTLTHTTTVFASMEPASHLPTRSVAWCHHKHIISILHQF